MSGTTTGYLLIADITGYTAYLSESELEHAQGTLTALLEVLLDQTRPPLVLSRLAGDAVVSYALGDAFTTGQTFVEMIENTYVAFRRLIDRMVVNNTCPCTACRRVGDLDLKFFVHYGTFVRQKLSAHEELLGNDVNLLHRLTKNKVVESTGITAYALYTQAVMDRLGLDGLTTGAMKPHRESYEHLGEVPVWIADMAGVWSARKSAPQETLGPVLTESSIEIAVPPAVVWGYVSRPEHLQKLLGAREVGFTALAGGRMAQGSVVHCFHGDRTTNLTVADWAPFERVFVRFTVPLPVGTVTAECEYILEPTAGGTRLSERMGRPRGPWIARTITSLMFSSSRRKTAQQLRAFKDHIEADHGARTPLPTAAAPTAADVQDAARSSLTAPPAPA